jgi:exopolysaccharide production protein ExoQ
MSKNVALMLGMLLSFVSIVIDTRKEKGISNAIWLPTIWLMLSASKSIAFWLNPHSMTAFDPYETSGSFIDRAVRTLLMVIALLVILKRKLKWQEVIKNNRALFVVVIYIAISIAWSGYKPVAAKRWFRAMGDVLMALVILTEGLPLHAIKMMLKRAAYILLPLSIVLIKYFRDLGVQYTWDGHQMWVGVTSQKNTLGILACIVAILFIIEIVNTWRKRIPLIRRGIQIILLAISLLLLLRSNSSTAMGTFLIGLMIFTWSLIQKKTNSPTAIINVLLIPLVASVLISSNLLNFAVTMSGRDLTFTGRTEIWSELLRIGSQRPILGLGYGSLWLGDRGYDLWQKLGVRQAHNGYIEVYLETGIVGVFLVIAMIIQAYRNILRTIDLSFEYGYLRFIYFMIIVTQNVTETTLLSAGTMMWLLFLVVAIYPLNFTKTENSDSIVTKPIGRS